jgi:Bbp16
MFLDKMVFSDAQAVTASGATASTNVLDTEVASSNLGAGTPIWLVCRVNTTFVVCTGTTCTFDAALQDCATSGGTYTQIAQGFAYSTAEILKGLDLLTTPLPAVHKRYLKLVYTVATGSGFNSGAIEAFLTTAAPRT